VAEQFPRPEREQVLATIYDCQFSTKPWRPETDAIISALSSESDKIEDEFDLGFDHEGRLYLPEAMEVALRQLREK
jgi:hypothetical protein